VICVVLTAFPVLFVSSAFGTINTSDISNVRGKEVLTSEDLQIIDRFVAEAVQELVSTKDFASISKVRRVLLAYTSSSRSSAQAQYTEQFFKSVHKHVSEAFKQAGGLTPKDRRFRVMVNLLILVDKLQNLRLVDIGLGMLKSENMAIRYWAVRCVADPGIVKQLNSTNAENLQLGRRIIEELKGLVNGSSPEIIALMVKFAAEVKVPQAEELLLQIADMRIKKYAEWKVKYEFLDGTILRSLYERMSSMTPTKPAVARRFGQLYSYVMLRYINGRDFLGAAHKRQLASVLVGTEKLCISKLLGMPQASVVGIKRAIENDDYTGLLQEHNRLLGDKTKAGELPLKLKFDYGQNPDGSRRTAPLVLPKPPKRGARK